jgi:GTP-binding protein
MAPFNKKTMVRTIKKAPSLPLVALVGPTNAGKSTLFNRLTGSWQAVTAREESTTRDRVFGEAEWQGRRFDVVDTGGLVEDDSDLYRKIKEQTLKAVEEADVILFVFDATAGLKPRELQFLKTIRQGERRFWLVANKVDSPKRRQELPTYDFLGLPAYAVSGLSGKGVGDLLEDLTRELPQVEVTISEEPLIALVGRPNVGKSTLLNALTKSNRAVISPEAGTTRDIVTARLTIDNQMYLLADTAGVRRRGKVEQGPESFSVKRTLATISSATAVLVLIDATEGTTRGDLHLIYFAHELEKPLLIILNKIDLVPAKQVPYYRYLAKFPSIAISALTGENINEVIDWVKSNVAIGNQARQSP